MGIGNALLDEPEFWLVHLQGLYYQHVQHQSEGDPEQLLGISAEVMDEFYLDELCNEIDWPRFKLALKGGAGIEMVYANEPEDHELEYFLRPLNREPIRIAQAAGCWWLPGLRWQELVRMAHAAEGAEPGQCSKAWAKALLLFLPAVWLETADCEHARGHLMTALTILGVGDRANATCLVNAMCESLRSEVTWSLGPLGWTNNGGSSPRNALSPVALQSEEFRSVAEFFASL